MDSHQLLVIHNTASGHPHSGHPKKKFSSKTTQKKRHVTKDKTVFFFQFRDTANIGFKYVILHCHQSSKSRSVFNLFALHNFNYEPCFTCYQFNSLLCYYLFLFKKSALHPTLKFILFILKYLYSYMTNEWREMVEPGGVRETQTRRLCRDKGQWSTCFYKLIK